MKNTIRTFLAIRLANPVIQKLQSLIGDLKRLDIDLKWVAPENLHITVKFLGEVQLSDTAEICRVVAAATAEHERFKFETSGFGAFPRLERPRTFWIGVDEGRQQLVNLIESIDVALGELRFPLESKAPHPHVTIARTRREVQGLERLLKRIQSLEGELSMGLSPCNEVIIYSSELRREGPVYEVIGRAPLARKK